MMKRINVTFMWALMVSAVLIIPFATPATACTGISLSGADKGVVVGRSIEWGAFDLHSRVTIIPRGHKFTGLTPDGYTGKV